MDSADKAILGYKKTILEKGYSTDSVFEYIIKLKYFYGQIPYSVKHFCRVLKKDKVIPEGVEESMIKKVLEKLCQDKRLIRVGEEYMLHPEVAHNRIYVDAFSKKIKVGV